MTVKHRLEIQVTVNAASLNDLSLSDSSTYFKYIGFVPDYKDAVVPFSWDYEDDDTGMDGPQFVVVKKTWNTFGQCTVRLNPMHIDPTGSADSHLQYLRISKGSPVEFSYQTRGGSNPLELMLDQGWRKFQ